MTAGVDTLNTSFEIFQNLSSFVNLEFEPVGKWFEHYNLIRHQGDAIEEVDESSSGSDDEVEDVEETPEYLSYMESLVPKDWKDHDHYIVLGLENLRVKATPHQIKKAHKQKVLKHHPDKQKNAGPKERDFFACITKSFDILSNPTKRISFDSCDPTVDDDVPPANEHSKKNFYKVFGPAFERNARWSMKKKLPTFGDENTPFDDVKAFYSAWYDFDSWREFSYLDEESKDGAADRDERRWIDKQNKGARNQHKKEEVARMRQLVDNAYTCDPRIIKFKQDEKQAKEDVKNKRKEAIRLRLEEEAKKVEEARLAQEKLVEEEKAKKEADKKENEKNKKAIKKERKTLRTHLKDFNYFAQNDNDLVALMEDIEQLVDLLPLAEIQKLNETIAKSENKVDDARTIVFDMLKTNKIRSEELVNKMAEMALADQASRAASAAALAAQQAASEWCDEELKLLVKGVKIVAVGTQDRWSVVANFIEEHSRGKYKRSGKEVLAKTKELQRMDPKDKEEMNKKAYERTVQSIKPDDAAAAHVVDKPSERYTTPGEAVLADQGFNPAPWTADEQKILEQALKTYPASLADRWDQISSCLPTRSRKDCMARYKELVEVIMAKKKATQKK